MTMPVYMVDAYETDCMLQFVFTRKTVGMIGQLIEVTDLIDEYGDECAANNNVIVEKRPFNPVLATYVWEN